MLSLEDASLMIEQTVDPARTFLAAPLEHPYGRGMNLQIYVNDADRLYKRVLEAGCEVLLALEDR